MSLVQLNNLLKDELKYRLAFLTTKNGKSMRKLSTSKAVNLQFSFFSTPIWPERIFICSVRPFLRHLEVSENQLYENIYATISTTTTSEFY